MDNEQLLRVYRTFFVLGDATSLKILYELDRYGERTFTQLKNNLKINPASLSKKLKILMQFGLVASDKTHDHLRVFYSLHNHQRSIRKVLDSFERLAEEL
jgi:DNA-binding HxlR family transcriptional regulator